MGGTPYPNSGRRESQSTLLCIHQMTRWLFLWIFDQNRWAAAPRAII
jgi:hypothetical protein